jgi:hypothetical protein
MTIQEGAEIGGTNADAMSIATQDRGTSDQQRLAIDRGGDGDFPPGDYDALIRQIEVEDRPLRGEQRKRDFLGENSAVKHDGGLCGDE